MSPWARVNDRDRSENEHDAHQRECSLIAAFVRNGYSRHQAATMAWNYMQGMPIAMGANGGPAIDN